jgi:DNA-binding beta-propeller fold protein YncE
VAPPSEAGSRHRPVRGVHAGLTTPAHPRHRRAETWARSSRGELRLPAVVLLAATLLLGACATPSRRIAVTSGDDGAILLFSAGLMHVDTLRLSEGFLDRSPVGAWLAPDGTTLYAAHRSPTAGALVRARVADGTVLDRVDFFSGSPAIVYPLYDGRTVLAATVTHAVAGSQTLLHFLGTDLSAQSEPIPVCSAGIRGLATARTTDRLYALCDGDVLVDLDRRLRTFVRSVELTAGDAPTGAACDAQAVAVSSNGSIVFVLCAGTGTIRYLDRVTLEPVDSLEVGVGAQIWARSPDGQYAVMLRPAEREIVVADLRRRVVTGRPLSDLTPYAVTVGSDSRTAFVAAGDGVARGAVLEIDLASGAVVREHGSAARPVALSVWPGEESPVMRWKR